MRPTKVAGIFFGSSLLSQCEKALPGFEKGEASEWG